MNTPIFYDGLIRDPKMLNEDYREKDLLGWDSYIEQFAHELVMIPSGSILGFIGRFGSGKSTFLNQLNRFLHRANIYTFEAWKYPDRENLWINFVYEIAKNLGVEKTKEVLQKINGQDHNRPKAIISDLLNLGHLSSFKDFLYHRGQNQLDLVYEILKELLVKLSPSYDGYTYLVIEDIDRSGDRGIYFIETLNYFLKRIIQEQREAGENIIQLKVIVPISDDNYESDKQSYLKSIDYFHTFSPKNYNFIKFVNFLFQDRIVNETTFCNIFADFLYILHENYSEIFTIRQIKAILRATNSAYEKIVNSTLYDSNGLDYKIFLITSIGKMIPNESEKVLEKEAYSHTGNGNIICDTIGEILFAESQFVSTNKKLFSFESKQDRSIENLIDHQESGVAFCISSKYIENYKPGAIGFVL